MSIQERLRRELRRRGRAVAGRALARLPTSMTGVAHGAWVFGGSVGAAYNDNAAALHAHVRATRPDIDARWVIDRHSDDVARARAVGPVMFPDDVGTWAVARRARVHVISHGVHDVPLCASSSTRNVLKVRLGHGLTAMKKTKPRALHTNRSANAIFGLVPVASDFERDNKRAWDIDDEALVVTGLARFDPLLRRSNAHRGRRRRLLYMPTWRDGDARRVRAAVDTIAAFLGDPDLHRALVAHDVELDVYCHRNLAAAVAPLAAIVGGPVSILPVSHDVQAAIASCAALITDYSSTCWDALYIDRPVLFFQFDLDAFLGERGAYFDLRNDAPGPWSSTPSSAAAMVAAALDGGLALSPAARRWQDRAFAWRDDRNCERVLAAIEARLEQRR